MHSNIHCSAVYNRQDMEATQMSINRRMDKEDVVYTHTMEYYSATKRHDTVQFADRWMDTETGIQSKGVRKRKALYSMVNVEARKMLQMSLSAKQTQRHRHTDRMDTRERRGNRKNREIGVDIYILLCIQIWRRARQPTPVFLPRESHRQRSPAGYSPQCSTELDTTEGTWHACVHVSNR